MCIVGYIMDMLMGLWFFLIGIVIGIIIGIIVVEKTTLRSLRKQLQEIKLQPDYNQNADNTHDSEDLYLDEPEDKESD